MAIDKKGRPVGPITAVGYSPQRYEAYVTVWEATKHDMMKVLALPDGPSPP
jgi:hypothetical protein